MGVRRVDIKVAGNIMGAGYVIVSADGRWRVVLGLASSTRYNSRDFGLGR